MTKKEEAGHWTVNGVCACESEHTAGIEYRHPDGGIRYTTCCATPAEYGRMRTAVLAAHPRVDVQFVEGRCRKEGAT